MADFSELFSFVRFLTSQTFSKDFPFSISSPPRSLVEKLFQGIAKGEFSTEEKASEAIYGTPPHHSSFLRLKDRLWGKLIQHLYIINFEGDKFSHESQKYYKSLTNLVASRILLGMGDSFLARKTAKRTLKYAIENNQPEIGFLTSNILKAISREYPEKRVITEIKDYEQISDKFFNILMIENEIDSCYGIVIQNLHKGGNLKQKEVEQASQNLKSLQKRLEGISKIKLLRYYYITAVLEIYKLKFDEAIKICEIGLAKAKNSKIPSTQLLYLLKTQCYIHLNHFDKAHEEITLAEEKGRKRNHNKFQFLELKFLTFVRSMEFEPATKIYLNSISNVHFQNQPQLIKESWHQYGLLLLFLIQLGKIPPSESLDKVKPKLRPAKLMNEMPEYAKDKAGLNLSIRILHTMILLVSKRYEEFEDALPPLQAYIQRYIRKYPELSRSNLLVKMLSEIPKVGYDAERAAWRARTMLSKMSVPPEQLPLKITEMEVIPYEKMWQFVVEFLHTIKRRPGPAKKRDA